ncbi:MAG: hypothetical protein CSA20_08405 [Deltaproteobacteria bacterium]|nr:MAG: hypothetical protein CSA20_08405 [Deltaproteobacteria bacterium]
MTFAQPLWFFVALALCLGLWALFYAQEKQRKAVLQDFAAKQLVGRLVQNISFARRRLKQVLLILAVFLLCAALARPQYGEQWVEVKRKGIDLLFALDTSKSMLVEDVRPNRLKRASLGILDFVQKLEGDRIGLLPFAGSSFLMCPLTLDYAAFEQSLSAVTADVIPVGGTNLAGVIEAAEKILNNGANHKILIVLTDGEELAGQAVVEARKAAEKGLTVYTVGVGTTEGELIPLAGGGFVKDTDGNFVLSKLDAETLKKVAEVTGGLYVPLGVAGEGLETIYRQKLSLIPEDELAERRHKVPIDRFGWPLVAALLLLVAEFLLGEKRAPGTRFRATKKGLVAVANRGLAFLLLTGLLFAQTEVKASPGEESFARKDYIGASEYYAQQLERGLETPEIYYNSGVSAYKNNMYDDAIDALAKALPTADLELQEKIYFNLGNSYYQKGLETLQTDPELTKTQWQQAIEAYESVSSLDPEDMKARHNRKIVEERLKKLEEQKTKQEQNQEQNQEQKQQDEAQQQTGERSSRDREGQKEEPQSSDTVDAGQEEHGQKESGERQQVEADPSQSRQKKAGDSKEQTSGALSREDGEDLRQQGAEDALRRQQGKMTQKEAERLLDAMKNEDGELNFVPVKKGAMNQVKKDW